MDMLAELQKQNALLQQQNEALRQGRDRAGGQAEFLRQQQALAYGGQNDTPLNLQSSDWFSELTGGTQQAAPQAPATPAREETVSLTKAEIAAMIRQGARQEIGKVQQNVQNAEQTRQTLVNRLVQEHPDLAKAHAPIIQDVWNAQLALNPKATADELFQATIQKTRGLIDHVQASLPQSQHPYGVAPGAGQGGVPPWMQQQQVKQDPNNIFQEVPGNERPEWVEDNKSLNRFRRSKALNVYVGPSSQQRAQ